MPTPQQMALANGLDPQAVASLQGLRRNTQNTGSALAPPPMPASFNAPRPPPGGGMPAPMPAMPPQFDANAFRAQLPQVPRGPFGDPGIYGGMPTPSIGQPVQYPLGPPPMPPGMPAGGGMPPPPPMPGGMPPGGALPPVPPNLQGYQQLPSGQFMPSQMPLPQPMGPGQLLPPRGPGNIPY